MIFFLGLYLISTYCLMVGALEASLCKENARGTRIVNGVAFIFAPLAIPIGLIVLLALLLFPSKDIK